MVNDVDTEKLRAAAEKSPELVVLVYEHIFQLNQHRQLQRLHIETTAIYIALAALGVWLMFGEPRAARYTLMGAFLLLLSGGMLITNVAEYRRLRAVAAKLASFQRAFEHVMDTRGQSSNVARHLTQED